MATISSQTPLTTVREIVPSGVGKMVRDLIACNYSGSAVIAKIYIVPSFGASSTITDHLLWIVEVAANSTSRLDLRGYGINISSEHRIEAEAASNSAITLTVLGN
ncbi:MAG: hypothetical protein GOVbin1630_3 [Prokaryotic dsDNA virus sp.]|mgnify:CR=1 FL=1|nr:MAG: hypothetical protein GOVbin1630_3 [Prokaryotic dsDNA virus sp.]